MWQATNMATWTFNFCSWPGTYGTQVGLVTRLVAAEAASVFLASVELGDMEPRFCVARDRDFVWEAWHLRHSAGFIDALRCRGHRNHFVWQTWPLPTWTLLLCAKRGTYGAQLGLVTRLVAADTASVSFGRRVGTSGTQLSVVTLLVAAEAASV
eukprot:s500_g12.t1